MPSTNLEMPRPIENEGEEHLACALVVDTSGSMSGSEAELARALQEMKAAIESDTMARGRVELCLITFDDRVRVVQPFGPMHMFEPPASISLGGMTATHQAIDTAMRMVEERTQQYKAEGVTHKKPWIWLFTDGGSNDSDNGSFQRLMDWQNAKKCVFYGVGIGNNLNAEELKSMHKAHMMLHVDRNAFAAAFEFLSRSVSVTSASQRGQTVTMDLPPQIRIET